MTWTEFFQVAALMILATICIVVVIFAVKEPRK